MELQVQCWLGRYFWKRESSWVSPNTSKERVHTLPKNIALALLLRVPKGPLKHLAEPSQYITWNSSHSVGLSRVRQERKTLRSITSSFLIVLTVQTQRNAGFHELSPQTDIFSLECWALTTFTLSLWMGHVWLLGLNYSGCFCFSTGK